MTFEQILQFTIVHNATIIEVLIVAILLMVLFLALRAFLFMPEAPEEGTSSSMVELEGMLKKIIEQAGKVPLTVVPENQAAANASDLGSGAQAAQLSEEINQLRRELEVKQKEIEEVKASSLAAGASAEAPGGLSEADKQKLEAQIKELQAKLQEYEIISEDIADLSFYKEQNAKLQKELEAAKGGAPLTEAPAGATAATPAPTMAATPAAASATAEPAVTPVAEAKVKEEPAIVGKTQTKPGAPAEASGTKMEDLLTSETVEASAAATGSTPAATPAPGEEEAPVENVVDDQLMAEFAAAVQKQQGAPTSLKTETAKPAAAPAAGASSAPESSVLGEVDIEKMVQEAGQISAEGPEVSAEQALGTSLDEAKLLEEAKALQGLNTEEKKLMNDFENFVKKGEGQ